MKKVIIAVIVIAVMVLGGFSAYAIQGLDENDSTRILANDGYATLTTDQVGGAVSTTTEALKGATTGVHVTDTYSVFSLDAAFLKSLLENVSGSAVTFQFGYNGDKSAVTFRIKDAAGKDVFAKSGRCLGELPYTAAAGSNTANITMTDPGKNPVGFSGYYPDANLMRWQLKGGGTYTVATKSMSFGDIGNHWGGPYIYFLASRGVANGMGGNEFSPDGTLTRAQFVMFLAKMSMEDISKYSVNKFSDVKSNAWYYHAVSWAVTAGVTDGMGNGQFAPENRITREQVARMVIQFYRYMGIETKGIRTSENFIDKDNISGWAAESVPICQAVGVLNGYTDHSFRPQNNATRAEAATMCSRVITYGLVMPQ